LSEQEPLCNLCGLTCVLGCEGHPCRAPRGLVDAQARGGYLSTAGNGHGALDDMTLYQFSLCEWCLDWLFSQFKIPVSIFDYDPWDGSPEDGTLRPWRSAAERVAADDWRGMKREFAAEAARRDQARLERRKNSTG